MNTQRERCGRGVGRGGGGVTSYISYVYTHTERAGGASYTNKSTERERGEREERERERGERERGGRERDRETDRQTDRQTDRTVCAV